MQRGSQKVMLMRYTHLRAEGRLEVIIEALKFNQDNDAVISQLETTIADVVEAIGDMRAGPRDAEHYER